MKIFAWLLVFLILPGSTSALANTGKPGEIWRVSIAQLPGLADTDGQGVLVEFISQVAERAGVDVVYETLPFSRSLVSVATGKADLQVPYLELDGQSIIDDRLMYSDVTLFEVPFALYIKAGSQLDIQDLLSGIHSIETDAAHARVFPFPVQESDCLECSLSKIQLGRLDAFVYARPPVEAAIRELGLENQFEALNYRAFSARAVLPKNQCGDAINGLLNTHVHPARTDMSHPLFSLTN